MMGENTIVFPATTGTFLGVIATMTQNSVLETMTLVARRANGEAIDLSGKTLQGTIYNVTAQGAAAIQGTLTSDPDQGVNTGVFVWEFAAGDVGTPGTFMVQFTYIEGDQPWSSVPVAWSIKPKYAGTLVPGPGLEGVAPWLVAWLESVYGSAQAAEQWELLTAAGDGGAAFLPGGRGDWLQRRGLAVGDELTIPDNYQLIAVGSYTVDGTLTIEEGGELVVLDI
ncbi:MAG: hypothetical protein R6X32_06140 [Chloroflexota bacterium]